MAIVRSPVTAHGLRAIVRRGLLAPTAVGLAAGLGTVAPMDAATPTPAPTPAATPAPRPEPTAPPASDPIALGAYIPGAPSDPSLIDAFARKAGAMPAIVMWYQGWGGDWSAFYARGADAIRARGAMPLITWEPWDDDASDSRWRLDAIAGGDHDAYIRGWAADVAAWGHPIYVRPMHEMNGSWYPWGIGRHGNTPADFRDAWRHIVGVAREAGADNIRWVWCPNTLLDNGVTFESLYPGDAWVDWMCVDGYNWGDTRASSPWHSLRDVLSRSVASLSTLSAKPIMVGETGSGGSPLEKSRWIWRASQVVPDRWPRVRAVIWFDHIDDGVDWRVSVFPRTMAAFAILAADRRWQGVLP